MRAIKEYGDEDSFSRKKSLKMRRVAHLFWYRLTGSYLSKWKETILKNYTTDIRGVNQ